MITLCSEGWRDSYPSFFRCATRCRLHFRTVHLIQNHNNSFYYLRLLTFFYIHANISLNAFTTCFLFFIFITLLLLLCFVFSFFSSLILVAFESYLSGQALCSFIILRADARMRETLKLSQDFRSGWIMIAADFHPLIKQCSNTQRTYNPQRIRGSLEFSTESEIFLELRKK